MFKINPTKELSVKLIVKMISNLQKKFKPSYTCIHPNLMAQGNKPDISLTFWFDVDGIFHGCIQTWQKVLDKYKELMDDKYEVTK